jgi:thiamine pyrophosphate-dependent acetolactate synthase large subunit-like protein
VGHLVELAEALACPVISSDDRLNFPTTHPLNLTGTEQEQFAEADVILALDVWDLRWPSSTFDRATRSPTSILRPDARVIQVSLGDLSVRGWSHDFQSLHPTHLSILADTSLALPALTEQVRLRIAQEAGEGARARDARAAETHARHRALRAEWQAEADRTQGDRPIAVAHMAAEVWRLIQDEDWVLAFHAQHPWPQRLWNIRRADQYNSGFAGAGIGYGIGAAIGVALAHQATGKVCVALQPDGDLLYSTSALWTLAHERIPLLLVMHNNRSYYNSEEHAARMARFRQRPVERRGIGTQLVDPAVDFATVARGFGLWASGPIEDPAALRPALQQALRVVKEEGRAALVDVVTQPR